MSIPQLDNRYAEVSRVPDWVLFVLVVVAVIAEVLLIASLLAALIASISVFSHFDDFLSVFSDVFWWCLAAVSVVVGIFAAYVRSERRKYAQQQPRYRR